MMRNCCKADENGTYNFTDDLTSVPKKYRNKVQRNDGSDESTVPPGTSVQPEKGGAKSNTAGEKPGGAPQTGSRLIEGKAIEAWQAELKQKEAELVSMKKQLEGIKNTLNSPDVEERRRLTDEYNQLGAVYNQKYAEYNEALEALRRAGSAADPQK